MFPNLPLTDYYALLVYPQASRNTNIYTSPDRCKKSNANKHIKQDKVFLVSLSAKQTIENLAAYLWNTGSKRSTTLPTLTNTFHLFSSPVLPRGQGWYAALREKLTRNVIFNREISIKLLEASASHLPLFSIYFLKHYLKQKHVDEE